MPVGIVSLRDAKVGDVVEFTYNSGTNYGARRHVEVTEVIQEGSAGGLGYIRGEDLDDGRQIKTFSAVYAFSIIRENDEPQAARRPIQSRLTFPEVQRQLAAKMEDIPSERLAELYEELVVADEEVDVEFDTATGEIVVSEPEIEPYFTLNPARVLTVVNQQKEGMVIDFNEEKAELCFGYGNQCGQNATMCDPATPQELVNALIAHLELDT
jgi:hypothetical protein